MRYPSRFQLVAAMNPCRCGMAGEPGHTCRRGPRCASDYQARISGPLLDRIDIHLDVPAVTASDLMLPPARETSADIRMRVETARVLQQRRYAALGLSGALTNSAVASRVLEETMSLQSDARTLLADAADRMGLSARGYHRVLRVSRTLADLDASAHVGRAHVAEALSYRAMSDRLAAAA